MASLRERNRLATIDHVLAEAFALFEERGYEQVTIAEIAQAAQVSQSTFYRLFPTKESLFTVAPWADGTLPLEGGRIDQLAAQLRDLVGGYTWPGLRWVMTVPTVRRAVLASLDGFAGILAGHLAGHGADDVQAAVQARALLLGVYWTALERWYESGQAMPFLTHFDAALRSSGLGAPTLTGGANLAGPGADR